MTNIELAWAAGLFEGEGCFTTGLNGYPRACLKMTDEDVVRRFAAAVGLGHVTGPHAGAPKPYWSHMINGFERTQYLAVLLWHGLGERRRRRVREILASAPLDRY